MTSKKTRIKSSEPHLPIREEVLETLKDAILSGELLPGDRIVETQWAKKLGISQSPVRDALRILESMGLVHTVPYQGTYVSQIKIQDLFDAHTIRGDIESLAVHYAINRITDDDLVKMQTLLAEMEEAGKHNELNRYVHLDTEFHKTIVATSQNKLLIRLFEQLNVYEWTYFGTRFSSMDLVSLAERHESIYNALAARDEEKAREVVILHLQELIEIMRKNLAERIPINSLISK
ncbi:MAG: GntR family transcriptional regulator [Lachnospiraceae bacterium]|nr:GntR family transcriptional regulator [Lachnospiraceae bacterium]